MLNNNIRDDSIVNRYSSIDALCQNVKEIIEFWFLPVVIDFTIDTVAPLSVLWKTSIPNLKTLITFTTHYYSSLVQSYQLHTWFSENENINTLLTESVIPENHEITDRIIALQNIAKHVLNIGLTDSMSVGEFTDLIKPDSEVFIIIWLFEMCFIYQKIRDGRT